MPDTIAAASIIRPPLGEGFELPTREELLSVEVGDNVKLIFEDDETNARERMWVLVTEKIDQDQWKGTLDNIPFMVRALDLGDEFIFHPLDVIDFMRNN